MSGTYSVLHKGSLSGRQQFPHKVQTGEGTENGIQTELGAVSWGQAKKMVSWVYWKGPGCLLPCLMHVDKDWLPSTLLNASSQSDARFFGSLTSSSRPQVGHPWNPIAYCVSSTLFLKVSMWLSTPQFMFPDPLPPGMYKESSHVHWASTGS